MVKDGAAQRKTLPGGGRHLLSAHLQARHGTADEREGFERKAAAPGLGHGAGVVHGDHHLAVLGGREGKGRVGAGEAGQGVNTARALARRF